MRSLPFHVAMVLLCAMFLSHVAIAVPQVVASETSTISASAGDTLRFNNGAATGNGSRITLIALNGQEMTLVRSNTSINGDFDEVVFSLNGSGLERHGDWSAEGSLVGAQADGTWQVVVTGLVGHAGLRL